MKIREPQGNDRTTSKPRSKVPRHCKGDEMIPCYIWITGQEKIVTCGLQAKKIVDCGHVIRDYQIATFPTPIYMLIYIYHTYLISQVGSIGNSVQGRPLVYIKLSGNVQKVIHHLCHRDQHGAISDLLLNI